VEFEEKHRQSIANVKKKATTYANRARYLAQIMKTDDKILRKINNLEQKIQNASLNRNTAKNFCGKEIGQLQLILSDLEKRYSKNTARLEIRFCLLVIVVNLVVFIATYQESIPKGTYQTNSNFYIILGITTYIFLSGFLFLYFRFYRWLSINAVYPFLARVRSSSERTNIFFRWSTVFAIGSLFTLLFQRLVVAFATIVPTIVSPSMTFVELLSSTWAGFIQFFNSSTLVAIATFVTIVPFLGILLKKIYKLLLRQ
jgi:hypothetical protein